MQDQASQTEPLAEVWIYAVLGVISILFGLALIFFPHLTLAAFVLLFGIYAIVFGVVRLVAMFRRISHHRTWWPQLILGLAGLTAGVYVFVSPGVTALILLYAIAFWAIITGLLEIFAALTTAEFLLLIVGALTVVFGFIVLAEPFVGALALALFIGVFFIIFGIILLVHAFAPPPRPALGGY